VDLNKMGALVTKGLSREPIAGNPAPRLWHTDAGMINSIGLQNVGVKAFITDKLPKLKQYSVPVIANVFGYAEDDYLEVVRALEASDGLAAYELADLIRQIRAVAKRPLIVKLSPNVASIQPFARAAEEAGADAVSLVNTFISLAIDIESRTPRIGAGFGGLSGPAIKPIALRMVYEAAQAVKIPVIGLGGIASGEDAAEFLIAGARAVEVGTANFVDPKAPERIAQDLGKVVRRLRAQSVNDLVGTLRFPNSAK
jgi:dihydroorotate dehydrogenase (NAD+) catalytic subunit